MKDNQYIPIFIFWLANLAGKSILSPTDELILSFDIDTLAYLKESLQFKVIITQLPCRPILRSYPRPKTFLEGAIERFRTPLSYKSDILLYVDIDMILLKPVSFLAQKMDQPRTIYLHSEGQLSHFCYSHGFPDFLQKICTDDYKGFSSGKFAIRGKEVAALLFHSIEYVLSKIPPTIEYRSFYTGDQPLFNQALYRWLILKKSAFAIDTGIFRYPLLSVNRIPANPGACFCIDLMGEPGDEACHMHKILQFYPLVLSGWLG